MILTVNNYTGGNNYVCEKGVNVDEVAFSERS